VDSRRIFEDQQWGRLGSGPALGLAGSGLLEQKCKRGTATSGLCAACVHSDSRFFKSHWNRCGIVADSQRCLLTKRTASVAPRHLRASWGRRSIRCSLSLTTCGSTSREKQMPSRGQVLRKSRVRLTKAEPMALPCARSGQLPELYPHGELSGSSLLLRWLCGLGFTCRRHDPLQSQIGHHVPIVLIRVCRIDREQRQLR
jgi:hypothetical protein